MQSYSGNKNSHLNQYEQGHNDNNGDKLEIIEFSFINNTRKCRKHNSQKYKNRTYFFVCLYRPDCSSTYTKNVSTLATDQQTTDSNPYLQQYI